MCLCVCACVCVCEGGGERELVGALSPVNNKGYIRAEGDFRKEV